MNDEQEHAAENTGENTETDGCCPDNLRPYRWRKGQPSPNPGGRPKKAPLSDAYARHVAEPLPDDIRLKLKLPRGATWADAIALSQIRSALKGNSVAAKEIADRIEGRVPLPLKAEAAENTSIEVSIVHIGSTQKEVDEWQKERADGQTSAPFQPKPGRSAQPGPQRGNNNE